MSLHVDPVAPDFVTAVDGLDLSKPLGKKQVEEIEQLIGRYGVLVFHGQPLTEDEQVRFGEQFGPLNTGLQTKITNKVQKRLTSAALTDISNVDTSGNVADKQNKQAMMNVGNMFWHTDAAYENHPFCYSILAAQSAVSWGGETQYADLRDAYDSLDSRTKELLADKTGTFYSHTTRNWLGMGDTETDRTAYPPVRWPLVRTHPISGRKVLWVDSKVTEISDMSVPEGRALVHELIEHIGQRERVYTHSWRPDDVVMWDNRSVLHRGRRFDLTERREMRRVSTVDDSSSLGEVPFASAAL